MLETILTFFSSTVYALIIPGISAGVLALIISVFIPSTLLQYKAPVQLVGILLIIFFTYQAGSYSENRKWKVKALEDAVKIEQLENKSHEVTIKEVTKYVDKIQYIDRWRDVVIDKYIPAEADKQCKIDELAPKFRTLVDAAAKGIDIPKDN